VHLESGRSSRNRQPLITELPDDVKRLARWLLEREPQLVRRDRSLDLRAHVGRSLEVAIRRHQPVERLMRTLEVVVADEVVEPLLRVDHVREYRATQKLVPQRLPEPLDLAQRLRMLRPATDVLHAEPRQVLLELGLAAPHRVLPTVVGQDLGRRAVRGHAALERFHHQRRLLVMRERVADHEPAVVVHEHAHVQPLRAPQPEREDVRLPHLVRCRALEPPRRVLSFDLRRRRVDQPLRVQDRAHLLLADPERLEPLHDIANPPRAPGLVLLLELDDLLLHGTCLQRTQARAS
jgi:hypothetical protein